MKSYGFPRGPTPPAVLEFLEDEVVAEDAAELGYQFVARLSL